MTPLHLASVLLAAVFLASAWGKRASVTNPDDGVTLWRRLGIPSLIARPFTVRLLLVVEVIVAVLLLLPGWAGVVGALLALVLLGVFCVVVGYALRAGNITSCGCFGAAGPPVSRFTLWRNAGLIVLGALALTGHLYAPAPPLNAATVAATVLLVAALALAVWAVVTERDRNLVDQMRRIEVQMADEIEVMREALANAPTADEPEDYQPQPLPDLDVDHPEHGRIRLAELVEKKPVVLVGFSAYCGVCEEAVESIPQWQEQLGDAVEVVAIHRESAQPALQRFPHLEGHLVVDTHGYVFRVLGLGNPSAILLGADHTISGGPIIGANHIPDFINDIAAQLKEAGLLPD